MHVTGSIRHADTHVAGYAFIKTTLASQHNNFIDAFLWYKNVKLSHFSGPPGTQAEHYIRDSQEQKVKFQDQNFSKFQDILTVPQGSKHRKCILFCTDQYMEQ